jgi:hypothetical protein
VSGDRRSAPRSRRRIHVEYGETELITTAFGLDISAGGIFLTATKLLPVGTRIHIKVASAALTFYAEGVVVRHKLVLPTIRSMDPQGIGVRFLTPHELVEGYVGSATKTVAPFSIACATPGAMAELVREQIGRHVLVVPTGDPAPAADATLDFQIVLEFSPVHRVVSGQGRVIQLLSRGVPEMRAAVLELQDVPALLAELQRGG